MGRIFSCVYILLSSAGFKVAETNTTSSLNQAGNDQTGLSQSSVINQQGDHNSLNLIQITDNNGLQNAEVLQNGSTNQAVVNQSQTGSGSVTPSNDTYLQQAGDYNKIRQQENAQYNNFGQPGSATHQDNQNVASQNMPTGLWESLAPEQVCYNNSSPQFTGGRGNNIGKVIHQGDGNYTIQSLNGGASSFLTGKIVRLL